MNENKKISVSEYLEDRDLLELNYTPYDIKVEIVDVIISQIIETKEQKTIDSAILHRVSDQVFIEESTNIDFSILSEEGLGGYDKLCLEDELDELLYNISSEYERFTEILEYKLADFYRYENSTSSTLLSLKNQIIGFFKKKSLEMQELINNIDSKEVAEKLKNIINENLERYKG